jgi:CheY-like chemotaxis protein
LSETTDARLSVPVHPAGDPPRLASEAGLPHPGPRQSGRARGGAGLVDPSAWNSAAHRGPLHILLAEDHPVNQRLAVRLLERQGHQVRVVQDGRAAIQALEAERFDLVLMDIQMPEMNGLEATMAIRQGEWGTSRHVPIIAMTAHAMAGDRERCLAAGMDGYVSKPLRAEALFDEIARLVHGTSGWQAAPSGRSLLEVVDSAAVLSRVGGDIDLLQELAALFSECCPSLLEEIRSALTGQDCRRLERAAYALRSAVSNFHARAASDAALRLERIGREGDLSLAESAVQDLIDELERLKPALSLLSRHMESFRDLEGYP